MQCDYYDRGACRSCTWMNVGYADQLARLEQITAGALGDLVPADVWLPVGHGRESGFRNKAKLVVGGRRGAPTLGILDGDFRGVDLTGCGLYEPGLSMALPALAQFVAETGLTPYDIPRRTGELKHLIVTHSPAGELMVRFVLRSPGQLRRLEDGLPDLLAAVPGLRVVTANLQPEHKAVLEGPDEAVLTDQLTLPMPVNDVVLHLGPRSFFQTNTEMAALLYRQAASWIDDDRPSSVLDLYCGVGGFAMHAADGVRAVRGLEVSADAVRCAERSVRENAKPLGDIRFETADADAELAIDAETVIVNPPRRGIGADLAAAIEASDARTLIYSSCHPGTLARDLRALPSWRVNAARLIDMFPQTTHAEVLIRLARAA
ncbi:methyltransferase domain-containing protein [Calidifontibacter sp. DB0510]|uniref:Methyltransferase domain-containing protein n=1 Tax=Metallococcus carri TaxID=1656884 RepID=A0A967AXC6_9MICO|nr:methyltransferase domain-containing protein [Metallococcus carri]NHN54734.1 methyltransferase domain-containing protein [Metallococcus carri]NOP37079.1 methyltransferase domain-containing protein [Calidifontibacter sp. DB2511S]